MVTVISPHLLAAGAAWDDEPDAGGWIADRLGPFGPSVGHAVPLGYDAYALVPIPIEDDPESNHGSVPTIETMVDVLDGFTGEQPVHFGIWDGWSFWYDTGADPRAGLAIGVYWSEDDDPPTKDEIERMRAEGRELFAAEHVESPDAERLDLPSRRYFLWTGPLRSATAFRHEPHNPPSLIWPEDRSWFAGIPIYTNEIAVAGTTAVVDALLSAPRLNARPATPDEVLDVLRAARSLRRGADRETVLSRVRLDYAKAGDRFGEAGDTAVREKVADELDRWLHAAGFEPIEAFDEITC